MSSSRYFTLKETRISNNCPECYSNDGIELTFKQKLTENSFYKAITADIINEMQCINCNTEIFPIQWTDDIESVVEYQKRALQPKPKSIKLKPLAWLIIIVDVLLLVGIILFSTGVLSF
ncbi:hypothetical protein H8K90_03865 [Winogradskyella echinorum]|uniref:Uncharacterized protein n=1 Tax=Winogradskyella echinorum TaxID=538189 RepID=A0ABR6XZV1_9FLAO|nr:hypothetical protein [Winogradskyella echinorum]MBC3845508.1 hypothetical protein [Winogradskyella echinorum]MBC5749856.1 hypothetical protein [Winogradskyella echinorum]